MEIWLLFAFLDFPRESSYSNEANCIEKRENRMTEIWISDVGQTEEEALFTSAPKLPVTAYNRSMIATLIEG